MSRLVKQRKYAKRIQRNFEGRMTKIEAKLKLERQDMGEAQAMAREAITDRMKTVSYGGIYDL